MFKRYNLEVAYSECLVYSADFSSINQVVKFACGFDDKICDMYLTDNLFEKSLPIYELIKEFKNDCYGI